MRSVGFANLLKLYRANHGDVESQCDIADIYEEKGDFRAANRYCSMAEKTGDIHGLLRVFKIQIKREKTYYDSLDIEIEFTDIICKKGLTLIRLIIHHPDFNDNFDQLFTKHSAAFTTQYFIKMIKYLTLESSSARQVMIKLLHRIVSHSSINALAIKNTVFRRLFELCSVSDIDARVALKALELYHYTFVERKWPSTSHSLSKYDLSVYQINLLQLSQIARHEIEANFEALINMAASTNTQIDVKSKQKIIFLAHYNERCAIRILRHEVVNQLNDVVVSVDQKTANKISARFESTAKYLYCNNDFSHCSLDIHTVTNPDQATQLEKKWFESNDRKKGDILAVKVQATTIRGYQISGINADNKLCHGSFTEELIDIKPQTHEYRKLMYNMNKSFQASSLALSDEIVLMNIPPDCGLSEHINAIGEEKVESLLETNSTVAMRFIQHPDGIRYIRQCDAHRLVTNRVSLFVVTILNNRNISPWLKENPKHAHIFVETCSINDFNNVHTCSLILCLCLKYPDLFELIPTNIYCYLTDEIHEEINTHPQLLAAFRGKNLVQLTTVIRPLTQTILVTEAWRHYVSLDDLFEISKIGTWDLTVTALQNIEFTPRQVEELLLTHNLDEQQQDDFIRLLWSNLDYPRVIQVTKKIGKWSLAIFRYGRTNGLLDFNAQCEVAKHFPQCAKYMKEIIVSAAYNNETCFEVAYAKLCEISITLKLTPPDPSWASPLRQFADYLFNSPEKAHEAHPFYTEAARLGDRQARRLAIVSRWVVAQKNLEDGI